jgi:hypothetical protein
VDRPRADSVRNTHASPRLPAATIVTCATTITTRVSSTASDDDNDVSDATTERPSVHGVNTKKAGGGGLVGYPGTGRLSLALDGYSRMALPSETAEEAQKRPISDILWGFVMCFFTIAVLCHVDAFIGATTGQPFMIGAWGTISILAFGAVDNPVLR